jgi:hypothetical protein
VIAVDTGLLLLRLLIGVLMAAHGAHRRVDAGYAVCP